MSQSNSNKLHSDTARINITVPFKWENKPGVVSKKLTKPTIINQDHRQPQPQSDSATTMIRSKNMERDKLTKLPPPPCHSTMAATAHHAKELQQIPLPPCICSTTTCQFQSPTTIIRRNCSTTSTKGNFKHDPFLMALEVCTKSSTSGGNSCSTKQGRRTVLGVGVLKRSLLRLSCKHATSSIGVRDDAITTPTTVRFAK